MKGEKPTPRTTKTSIVIDGSTLAMALSDDNLSKKLFNLGYSAHSVLCCRVSPKQKSDVINK
jgi:phospholipid-translocating ATPase